MKLIRAQFRTRGTRAIAESRNAIDLVFRHAVGAGLTSVIAADEVAQLFRTARRLTAPLHRGTLAEWIGLGIGPRIVDGGAIDDALLQCSRRDGAVRWS